MNETVVTTKLTVRDLDRIRTMIMRDYIEAGKLPQGRERVDRIAAGNRLGDVFSVELSRIKD